MGGKVGGKVGGEVGGEVGEASQYLTVICLPDDPLTVQAP